MTIKNLIRSISAVLGGCVLCLLASSMSAYAASPPSSQVGTPRRLTVADFMGTWKVFSKSGEEVIPSINAVYQKMIGKTAIFSKNEVVDHTGGLIAGGGEISIKDALSVMHKPVYVIEYKKLDRDTPYPDIQPPPYQYPMYPWGEVLFFKVGWFDKTEKKILYTRFYVGSNDKSLPFALTLDLGDTDLYLCKVNPKTGQCQDHP